MMAGRRKKVEDNATDETGMAGGNAEMPEDDAQEQTPTTAAAGAYDPENDEQDTTQAPPVATKQTPADARTKDAAATTREQGLKNAIAHALGKGCSRKAANQFAEHHWEEYV